MTENLASESEQLDNSIRIMEEKNTELSELATRKSFLVKIFFNFLPFSPILKF